MTELPFKIVQLYNIDFHTWQTTCPHESTPYDEAYFIRVDGQWGADYYKLGGSSEKYYVDEGE